MSVAWGPYVERMRRNSLLSFDPILRLLQDEHVTCMNRWSVESSNGAGLSMPAVFSDLPPEASAPMHRRRNWRFARSRLSVRA